VLDHHAAGGREREVGAVEDVLAPELERVEAELAGGVLDHLLAGGRLHHPRTAVRRGAARVGVDGGALPAEVGDAVAPGDEHPDERPGRPTGHRVRAGVVEVLHIGRDDDAVVVHGQGHVALLLAGVRRRDQVLAPVLRPLDRGAELVGRERDDDLLAADERLQAEAPTDVADLHPDLVLGHPGRPREDLADLVRVLARHPHVEPLIERLPPDDDGAALHGHHRVPVLDERLRHDVRRPLDHRPTVVRHRHGHLHHHVAGSVRVHRVPVARQRGVVVHDRIERVVVVDLDQFGGVFREVATGGDDQHDRVADEAHVVDREREHR
jgi:hypothetical protein